MSVDIRGYRPADHARCRDLWAELVERRRLAYDDASIGGPDPGAGFEEYVTRLDLSGLWVAVAEEEVVGMTGLLVDGRHGEIEPLVVTEAMRDGGIGTRLLEHVTDEARRRRLSYLSIRPDARGTVGMRTAYDAGFTRLARVTLTNDLGEPPASAGTIRIHGLDFDY